MNTRPHRVIRISGLGRALQVGSAQVEVVAMEESVHGCVSHFLEACASQQPALLPVGLPSAYRLLVS
jgi:hypothetical protein